MEGLTANPESPRGDGALLRPSGVKPRFHAGSAGCALAVLFRELVDQL